MNKPRFETIHPDIVPVLMTHRIKESDLYNHYSDLYIGCPSWDVAQAILIAGIWQESSSIFVPQKGSDMQNYPVAIDIGFGFTGYLKEKLQQKRKVTYFSKYQRLK